MRTNSDANWEIVVSLSDLPSAHALAERLRTEGVPTKVTCDTPLLGEARACEVRVPATLAHRARWLLAQSQLSDEELNFLATGETR